MWTHRLNRAHDPELEPAKVLPAIAAFLWIEPLQLATEHAGWPLGAILTGESFGGEAGKRRLAEHHEGDFIVGVFPLAPRAPRLAAVVGRDLFVHFDEVRIAVGIQHVEAEWGWVDRELD